MCYQQNHSQYWFHCRAQPELVLHLHECCIFEKGLGVINHYRSAECMGWPTHGTRRWKAGLPVALVFIQEVHALWSTRPRTCGPGCKDRISAFCVWERERECECVCEWSPLQPLDLKGASLYEVPLDGSLGVHGSWIGNGLVASTLVKAWSKTSALNQQIQRQWPRRDGAGRRHRE